MYTIRFSDSFSWTRRYAVCKGELNVALGNFRESFGSSLSVWTKSDYAINWIWSIVHFSRIGTACLPLTWRPTNNPKGVSGEMLVLYALSNGKVAIRHNLILNEVFGIHRGDFTIPELIAPKRILKNEDGDRISEWLMETGDLYEIADSIRRNVMERDKA